MENREMGGQGSCEVALGKGEMKRGETVENGLIRERGLGKGEIVENGGAGVGRDLIIWSMGTWETEE